jgi:ribonuclease HI
MRLHAFTDGASRGNPGDAGIGFIVRDEAGNVVLEESGYIGRATNNVAEYRALLALLRRMSKIGCSHLVIHSDSELMVRQMNGQYKVKDRDLKEYYQQALELKKTAPFSFELRHVAREMNREADRLANQGIDSRVAIVA